MVLQLEEHEYEGTTATAVYIWREGDKDYLQSANVGDSTPFLWFDKRQTVLF